MEEDIAKKAILKCADNAVNIGESTEEGFPWQNRKRSKPYTAEDPDAISYYGRTKTLGDIIDDQNLTIRTSVGPELKSGGIGLFH